MALTKTQLTIGGLAIAALTASLVMEKHSQATLRKANESLQQRIAQLSSDRQSLADQLAQRRAAPVARRAPQVSKREIRLSVRRERSRGAQAQRVSRLRSTRTDVRHDPT